MDAPLVLDVNDIKVGDLLIISDIHHGESRERAFNCKEILNAGTGKEEILLTNDGSNIYFIWSLYESGSSWVKAVWNVGQVEVYQPDMGGKDSE